MVNKAHQELLGCLGRLAHGDVARRAQEAHARFHIREPTVEEIARYAKCNSVESAVANRCVESLLSVRTKPLPKGQKQEIADFQKAVLGRLESSVRPQEGRLAREFGKLVLSVSRLIARYYTDVNGKHFLKIDGRLEAALPYLAEHLLAETGLCLEAKFHHPSVNLSKVSIFDIQAKLEELQKHPDKVVRDNAASIISAALSRANLALADVLASGAKAKLEMLQKHSDEIVRDNAKTIVSVALSKGSLALADTLASGAKAKLKELQKHSDAVVKEYAKTIVYAALSKGSLALADKLASGVKAKLKELQEHPNARIKKVAPTLLAALLNYGSLDVDRVTANGELFVLKEKKEAA